jgi:voltage-gated potassium channel
MIKKMELTLITIKEKPNNYFKRNMKKIIKIKKFIFYSLEIKNHSIFGRIISIFLVSLIILNVLAVILSTSEEIYSTMPELFLIFETFSVVIFTLEFILRVITCTVDEKWRHPIIGRIKYIFSFMSIIDILAILPFYFPFIIKIDLRFLRSLRLFRIVRLFKLAKYAKAFDTFKMVLKNKMEQLLTTLFLIIILIIISSSLLYFAENEAQPKIFKSIPAAMWWAVVSLTTVGYGDMFPVTFFGKIISAIILILSIGIFAIPAGIIASGFNEHFENKNKKIVCNHCHKEIDLNH